MTSVSIKEIAERGGDESWRLVDCRFALNDTEAGRGAFLEGHIPGAVYAHLDNDLSGPIVAGKTGRHPMPVIEDLAATFSRWGIDRSVTVVAYDDAAVTFAPRLWWLLRWMGHDRVAVLDGGWPAYVASGLPCETGVIAPTSRDFVPRVRSEMVISAEQASAFADDEHRLLIDSRAEDRYRGVIEPIDPVAGHIPGAINLPFSETLTSEGHLLERGRLREYFEEAFSGSSVENVAFYCGSGVTAAQNVLACEHAGLGLPRLYAGSWSEWVADPARPVACE